MTFFSAQRTPRFSSIFALSLLTACAVTTSSDIANRDQPSTPTATARPVDPRNVPSVLADTKPADAAARPAPSVYRNVQDTPEAEKSYQEAKTKISEGQARDALPLLESYLKTQPQGEHADDTLFYLGKQAFANNDSERAIRHFQRLVALQPPSKLRGQAFYLKAVAEAQTGQRRESLTSLAAIDPREVPVAQRYALFSFWGNTALQEGRALESTLAYLKALPETQEPERRTKLVAAVNEQIESRLSDSELQFLLREYPSGYPSGEAQLRLVALRLADGKRDEAQQILARLIREYPEGTPIRKQATELNARLGSLQVSNTGRIGALLPLSGDQESLGRAVADGLREALAKAEPHAFEIILADAGSTAESARAAFERLVLEDKVMAVVGPLAGSQAEAVAARASEFGVPNISLAARPGLPESRPFVFQVALTPQKQLQALVGYSRERLNAKNFAILFPRDSFGREFASSYFKTVKEWGGHISAADSYDPDQSDFRVPIQNMTGMAFPHFRKTELEDRLRLGEEKMQRKLTKKEIEANGLQPIVDFDVLLVPDTFRAVGQIVPALLYANVTTPKILGPSTWHNPRLLARAGQYMDGALFVDLFSASRQSQTTRSFVDRFQVAKGAMPSALAAVGFDVGLALKAAYGARSAPETRDELRSKLESLGSFEGACGLYNWNANREPLAEVQLFTVKRGAFSHMGGVVIRSSP